MKRKTHEVIRCSRSGRKSVAYAFTYRNPERTLTDAEVNAAHEKLMTQLKERLGAVIRDS